jgi:hypothetical protein
MLLWDKIDRVYLIFLLLSQFDFLPQQFDL